MIRAEKRRREKANRKAAKADRSTRPSTQGAEIPTLTVQQALAMGVEHHQAGRIIEAENIYWKILDIEPGNPFALHFLGVIAIHYGDFESAIPLIEKAISIKAEFPEAHNNLGLALQGLGKADDAQNSYRAAIAGKPNFAEAYNNLGISSQSTDELDEAQSSYLKAISINPNYAEAHYNLGSTLQAMGKRDEALESYRAALSIHPDYAEVHNNIGVTLEEQGKRDEALTSYEKALSIKPNFAEAHNNHGVTLRRMGQLDQAQSSYRKAISADPDYTEARYNLGVTLQDLGEFDEAIEWLDRADPEARKNQASAALLECYYRKKDMAGFERQLERISNNQPFNFRAACASAFVAQQMGTANSYAFCDNPVDLVSVYDVLKNGDMSPELLSEITSTIKSGIAYEKYEQGHVTTGSISTGNLFADDISFAQPLEQVIRRCVGRFVETHNDDKSRIFRDWPTTYSLDGWYVRLFGGGEISAHVHEGWLSGVFYVQAPVDKKENSGNIEFTLNGYDLPVIHENFPRQTIETQTGRLVLFPSSLPHRVFPFLDTQERISLAFDIIPA